jgi:hypothetical protein
MVAFEAGTEAEEAAGVDTVEDVEAGKGVTGGGAGFGSLLSETYQAAV